MFISVGKGRYSATGTTESDVYMRPRTVMSPTKYPPILYCHGATESPYHPSGGVSGPAFPLMIARLVDLGRWVFAADLGPNLTQWANATSMSRMTDLYNWARTLTGYTGAGVHLLGSSMGSSTAHRWAAQNPAKVLSITGLIPVTGIQWCRDNNTTLRAQIDAAWGITYPAALPAGADPFTDATSIATLRGIPFLGYSASDDTAAAPLANTNAWATTIGGTSKSVGPLGHTDAAQGAAPYDEIHQFMAAHGG